MVIGLLRMSLRAGFSSSMEHARKKGGQVASIWASPEVLELQSEQLRAPLQRVDLDMCRLGKPAKNAISMFLSTLQPSSFNLLCNHVSNWQKLQDVKGIDDNLFRTDELREYQELCAELAREHVDTLMEWKEDPTSANVDLMGSLRVLTCRKSLRQGVPGRGL